MSIIKKITIFAAFLSMLFFCSCGDDDNPSNNNNPTLKNYLPMTIGSWWVFESYQLNQDGSKNLETLEIDSSRFTGTEELLGIMASIFRTYDQAGVEKAIRHYYKDSSKVFTHSAFINSILEKFGVGGIKLPFNIGDRWVKIADPDDDAWDIADSTFENFVLTGTITISGRFTLKGQKGTTKVITVGTENLTCQEFKLIFEYKGTISIDPATERIFTVAIHNWFADGKGIMENSFDPASFDVGLGNPFQFPGKISTCVRYHIE